MNIDLPDPIISLAKEGAARAGFASVADYVAELVRHDSQLNHDDDGLAILRDAMAEDGEDPATIEPERLAKRKREVDAMLLEAAADGPGTPMTSQDWKDLRTRVLERIKKQPGPTK